MADGGVLGTTRVILASGSPRRAAILRTLGIDPEVRPADIDETPRAGENAVELVERLATAKLTACCRDLAPMEGPSLIIAADTVVGVEDSIMGKPEGKADAERMLTALSGRTHQVITGIAAALISSGGDHNNTDPVTGHVTTDVRFRVLDPELLEWYVGTGEPLDKAGAYAIQGRGALLVEEINGSYPNVVGLPVVALDHLCRQLGHSLHALSGRTRVVGRDVQPVAGTRS